MSTYIILLRGVMPTGKNSVRMAALRAALVVAGLEDVRTYIQSGNIVCKSNLKQPSLENLVHKVIAEKFGGDIAVIARTASQFRDLVAQNPFHRVDNTRLFLTLLSARPEQHLVEQFLAVDYSPVQVRVIGDVVYLLTVTRYSDSKVNNSCIERKLHVTATTRVYNTIARLVEMAEEGRKLLSAGTDQKK